MKIAIVCANGKAGQLITKEAVDRGLDVTAIVRGNNRSEAKQTVSRDIFKLQVQDVKDFDVVVDAFGAWTPETIPQIPQAAEHLCSILAGSNTRLIVVGGAGSLYVNAEHTLTVADGADFPEAFKPLAAAHDKALAGLRKRKDVKWTYISPAADFQAEGARTGEYILAGEDFTVNDRGKSVISYADYAIAVVDEIVAGSHVQERISVVGK